MEQAHGKKEEAEPLAGVQRTSGDHGAEGGQNAGRIGTAVRRSPEPDRRLKDATHGTLGAGIRRQSGQGGRAGRQDDAGQDWPADAGE